MNTLKTPDPGAPQPATASRKDLSTIESLRLDTESEAEVKARHAPLDVALDDTLFIRVDNLDGLKAKVNARYPGKDLKENLGLMLDGEFLLDVPPKEVSGKNELSFHLKRTEANKQTWRRLFRKPWHREHTYEVALGLKDGTVLTVPSEAATIHLEVIGRNQETGWFLFGMVVLWLSAGALAIWSNLLRETSLSPSRYARSAYSKEFRPPYSLAKFQMYIWLLVVVSGFMFVWLATGDIPTFPTGLLVLLGISATTALGSVLVNQTKQTLSPEELNLLEGERKRVDEALRDLASKLTQKQQELNDLEANRKNKSEEPPAQGPAEQQARAQALRDLDSAVSRSRQDLDMMRASREFLEDRLRVIDHQLTTRTSEAVFAQSEGFVTDILKDVNGVSLHRFQIIVWTFVLVIIFVRNVYLNLEMATFDETLLTLLGISAGTYIGFKFPEKQA